MNITTAELSDGGLALLNHKLKPFNRKAKRWGLEPVTVTVTRVEERTWIDDQTKIKHTRKINHVEVCGEIPRINGWIVAARIEFTGTEAGNFVITAPGVESVNPDYRLISNVCDHCHSQRHRRDLIVIRHEDGNEMAVGRNCLADFIRTTDAEKLVEFCDWRSKLGSLACDAEDEFWREGGGRYVEPGYAMVTLLQAASLCIRKLGWMSATAARETEAESTKSHVLYLLNPPSPRDDGYREWCYWREKHDLCLTEHDAAEAQEAAEWLATLTPGNSDYLHNLCVLRELEYVPSSKVGIAVSIITAAKKAKEQDVKRREFAKTAVVKEFIGELKQRLRSLEATVKRVRSFPSDFGVTTIIAFQAGNCELTWFASGDRTEEYQEGQVYTIDATVKEHKNDERFGKSTVVNRVAKKKISKVA